MHLSEKSYSKFFGRNFLGEVLDLMPDLQEMMDTQIDDVNEEQPDDDDDPTMMNTVGRFLHHLSSPMVHPQHMPGNTANLYEAAIPKSNKNKKKSLPVRSTAKPAAKPIAK